jgi:hypothetical protein
VELIYKGMNRGTKRYLKMSDSEESMSTMPVLQKRPKISLPTNTDGSGDDQVKKKKYITFTINPNSFLYR